MINAFAQRKRSQRGASIVEFSLVFLLFLVVVVALFEFGRGMWTYATISHAARQAARFCMIRGSVNPATTSELRTVVERHCKTLDLANLTINSAWNDVTAPASINRGDIVMVRVNYPFKFVAAPLLLAGDTIQMSSTSRVVVAN